MNPFMAGVARAAIETFAFPEPILEVGSYQVPGQEEIANLRGLLPGREFVGIDMRPGPGVDSVENVEALPRLDHSAGSVFALNVFEHVERFWKGFAEIERVLRPDGMLMVSCPFYFRVHNHPSDYWRFTPSAFESLLAAYPAKIIGHHGPAKRPLHVWAVASKAAGAFGQADKQRFDDLIRRYARQPLSWSRRLRYSVGQWLCGKGVVGPKLEAESFATQLLAAA